MEKKMETAIEGSGFRVLGPFFWGGSVREGLDGISWGPLFWEV